MKFYKNFLNLWVPWFETERLDCSLFVIYYKLIINFFCNLKLIKLFQEKKFWENWIEEIIFFFVCFRKTNGQVMKVWWIDYLSDRIRIISKVHPVICIWPCRENWTVHGRIGTQDRGKI